MKNTKKATIIIGIVICIMLSVGGVIYGLFEDQYWARVMFGIIILASFMGLGLIYDLLFWFPRKTKKEINYSTHNNCVEPSVEKTLDPDKITIEELLSSSGSFRDAYYYALRLYQDELFKLFDELDYEANGFPAIMLHKMCRNNYWEATLRNVSDWRSPSLECIGVTPHRAMCQMYAWCVHKNYLPHPEKHI